MSARSMIVFPGRGPRSTPTTPVPPMPFGHLVSEGAQAARDERGGAMLFEAEFGVLMEVAAHGDDVGDDVARDGDGH